jgi:hypothetical protein
MAKSDLYEMIYKLAERGLNKSLAGEGTQESRAVALILSAVDQLATAATMDETMSPSIQQAIDVLRQQIEVSGGKQKKGDLLFADQGGDGGGDAKKEMAEKKTPDSRPNEKEKEMTDGR